MKFSCDKDLPHGREAFVDVMCGLCASAIHDILFNIIKRVAFVLVDPGRHCIRIDQDIKGVWIRPQSLRNIRRHLSLHDDFEIFTFFLNPGLD